MRASITALRRVLSAIIAAGFVVTMAVGAELTTPVDTDLAITYGQAGNPSNSYMFSLFAGPAAPGYIHIGDHDPIPVNTYTGSGGGDYGTGSNDQVAFYFRSSSPGTYTFELQYFDYINYDPIFPRATVTVVVTGGNTPPTISDLANRTISENSSTGAIAFTIGDAETAAVVLSVTGSSSNTTLVPHANIVFGGSGTNRTVTVTPAPGQTGDATITVTVTDGGTATATDTFVLTVNDTTPPTVTSITRRTPAAQAINAAASTVTFRVTYSETVSNVSPSEFAVEALNGGSVTGDVTNVSGSGDTRDVTVTITGGEGEFRLNVVNTSPST